MGLPIGVLLVTLDLGKGNAFWAVKVSGLLFLINPFNTFSPGRLTVHCWRYPSNVEGVALQHIVARRKKGLNVVAH